MSTEGINCAGHLSGMFLLLHFLCKGDPLLDFFNNKMLYLFLYGKNRNGSMICEIKNQAKRRPYTGFLFYIYPAK
ncbi:hypothetical protein DWZ14_01620 [Enterocloster citroniae]|nr:hypothetical protein DWZ14_01620 [Enterocloster citroniae]